MSRIARVICVVAALSLPAAASAQTAPHDSLLRRIAHLERTTADLERRVAELEALLTAVPAREAVEPSPTKWRDRQSWRQLRRGMTMDEVRSLLGEPERVDAISEMATFWRWGSGIAYVRFDGKAGRVGGWSEPDR